MTFQTSNPINELKTFGCDVVEDTNTAKLTEVYSKAVTTIESELPKAMRGYNNEACHLIIVALIDLVEVLDALSEENSPRVYEFKELSAIAEEAMDYVRDYEYDEQAERVYLDAIFADDEDECED
jgi:hypothetical protein